ncbi:MAG TPA: hypothetical protein DD671_17435, partial [Balneolaceae bacterium]|nr:hypothetical protein [Balneolaceae bacterium]
VASNNDFSPAVYDGEVADTVLSIGGLNFSTTYYWRVKSLNAGGESNWSSRAEFTTGAAQAGLPTLASPQNNATSTDTSLSFTWNAGENAVSYEIQVASDVEFNSVLREKSNVSGTSITFDDFEHEARYYWRVRTNAENTTSGWSSTFNFTTLEKENKPPVVENPMGSISLSEDFGDSTVVDLKTVFSDDQTSQLSFELIDFTEQIFTAVINENSELILTSIEDQFGNAKVVVSASDEDGASIQDTLDVTIDPVNDLPEFVQIPDTVRFTS